MGDYADMMLDGTLCAGCGEYIGDSVGVPVYCLGCRATPTLRTASKSKAKVKCNICQKRVRPTGLAQHKRDAHGVPFK